MTAVLVGAGVVGALTVGAATAGLLYLTRSERPTMNVSLEVLP